jgi:hypothetical protein
MAEFSACGGGASATNKCDGELLWILSENAGLVY